MGKRKRPPLRDWRAEFFGALAEAEGLPEMGELLTEPIPDMIMLRGDASTATFRVARFAKRWADKKLGPWAQVQVTISISRR